MSRRFFISPRDFYVALFLMLVLCPVSSLSLLSRTNLKILCSTQYRYITKVCLAQHKTEIKMVAEAVQVNVSGSTRNHALHHPEISSPTSNPLSYAVR